MVSEHLGLLRRAGPGWRDEVLPRLSGALAAPVA
jgi:hypothetical protein